MRTLTKLRKDCRSRQETLRFDDNVAKLKVVVAKLCSLYRANLSQYDLTSCDVNDKDKVIKALRYKGVPFKVKTIDVFDIDCLYIIFK